MRSRTRITTVPSSIVGLVAVMAFVTLAGFIKSGVKATAEEPLDRPHVVHALFDLSTPSTGPFPSNWFTVEDDRQNTGRRVALPLPDCTTYISDCEDLDVINELDGFNMQPRLSIPFDGSIDISSVTSDTVFLISLGYTLDSGRPPGEVVGINQVAWDVETTTLHVQSDEPLAQHTRYALIVTDGIRDTNGRRVQVPDSFRYFPQTVPAPYKRELLNAIRAARRVGIRDRDVVTASVFTTQSATAMLEKIRKQSTTTTPQPADFHLEPGGTRTVFSLTEVAAVTWNQQTGANPARFTAADLDLSGLRSVPGGVGRLAFGKYLSPAYLVHPGEFIPAIGTRDDLPVIQGFDEIYFNLYLPAGSKPAGGWPVAIFGHGTGGNKNGRIPPFLPFDSLAVAATMASHGIATIAINVNGHGFGPLGTLTVDRMSGEPVTFSAGGRAMDQNGDGTIGNPEGNDADSPRRIQLLRDGVIQTVADLIALVRVIEVGVDVEGDGDVDLDAARVYYFGHSLGGMYGVGFAAVEPQVRAAVFNVPGGHAAENRRLGARPALASLFAARQPSLINGPGITSIEGVPIQAASYFNENMPLRNSVPMAVGFEDGTVQNIQSPVVNTAAGAMRLQQWFDRSIWAGQAASPAAWAPHLRRQPLAGGAAKPVIFQVAYGDRTSQNPTTTTTLRAGDLADRTIFFRTDRAVAEDPGFSKNPHGFMMPLLTGGPSPLAMAIAHGTQEQIASFFASDGMTVIQPEPARFFEVPIVLPLPEDLNYIP
jgi:hypothetical protein